MSKEIEQRLATLERGYKAEKERGDKLKGQLEKATADNKRLRAHAVDQGRSQAQHIAGLQQLRDMALGPPEGVDDPRERYEELRDRTLKDKAGNAYYFTDGPAYVGDRYYVGFRNSPKGSQGDFIIVIPKEQDPSVQWEAVELGGRDPKTGQPVLRPLGTGEKMEKDLAAREADFASQFTNTELNERRSQQQKDLGGKGARAGGPPAPGAGPNDPKPTEVAGGRAADTTVG